METAVGLVERAFPGEPAGGQDPVVIQGEPELGHLVGDVGEVASRVVGLEEVALEEDDLGHAAGRQLKVDRVKVVAADDVDFDRVVGEFLRVLLHTPLHGVAAGAGRVVRRETNAAGLRHRFGRFHRDDLLDGDWDFFLDNLLNLPDLGDDLLDYDGLTFATGRQDRNASGS